MAFPTLVEVREFILVSASDASDDVLQEIYDGELLDQFSVCKEEIQFEDNYVANLRLALYRRIARTCALRGIPLGFLSTGEGNDPSAVANLDVEIRRFERPHRRMVAG